METLSAIDKYATTWYGSNLWDLSSDEVEMIYSAWRTNVKLTWNLPRNCKNFFITYLAQNLLPPKIAMLTRFHKFFHSLLDSQSPEVQTIVRLSSRDIRTNVGKNLRLNEEETG